MFAIDLLEGKARPKKIDLKRSVLKAVPFLVPAIAITAWAASYQQDRIRIEAQQAAVRGNQAVIDLAAEQVTDYRRKNARINKVRQSLETINGALAYRLQVSDLLVELVEGLPADIFIYEVSLQRGTYMKKRPKEKGQKDEEKEKLVVTRTLWLHVCGFDPVKSDQQVREYVQHLKTSPYLAEIFTEVKPAARRQGLVDQLPATYFEIECTLREQE